MCFQEKQIVLWALAAIAGGGPFPAGIKIKSKNFSYFCHKFTKTHCLLHNMPAETKSTSTEEHVISFVLTFKIIIKLTRLC